MNAKTGEISGSRLVPRDDKFLACGRRQRELFGDVGVFVDDNGRAGLAGLQTCGSGWACPVCSGKIQAERAAELGRVLAWAREQGHTLAMVTLTVRHKRGDSLASVWGAVGDGWSKVTAGTGAGWWGSESAVAFADRVDRWDAARQLALDGLGRMPRGGRGNVRPVRRVGDAETHGVLGWARAVEVTHGLFGWHVHVHAVLVLEGERTAAKAAAFELGDAMYARWAKGIESAGFTAIKHLGGLHVSVTDGAEKRLAEYLAKDGFASDDSPAKIRASVGKQGRKLGLEAALGDAKHGKRGGRTPFQVLRDIDLESPGADLAIWREWVVASAGHLALTWSRGLRALADLEDELSDGEVAAKEPSGVEVARLPHSSWYLVRDRRADLLNVVEQGGVPALCAWLERWGATWVIPD